MPNTPKPSSSLIENDSQAHSGFKPSRLDIVIHEGTVISPDDKRINGAVAVRQGVISVETDIDTPEGIKTVVLDHVEAGEFFFEHLLFGFKNESALRLRYRALKRSIVMVVTREFLSQEPTKLVEICGIILRTKNREADRLRQRAYSRQATQDAEAYKAENLASLSLKAASEDLAQDLETATFENQLLQAQADQLHAELERTRSALNEASKENQNLWAQVRMHERRAIQQDKAIESLKGKISILECEDAKKAFRELTAEILRAQEATASAKHMERDVERRLNLMQRGFELLSSENPKIKMSMTVMLLLLGEEPTNLPPNPEFDAQKTPREPTPDELDQIFEDMPMSVPAAPAKPVRGQRLQGLSSKVTIPPKANAAVVPTEQRLPLHASQPNPTVIDRPAPKQTATRDSMPEITYAQEEADTGLREIMRQAGEPVRQHTLPDPFEVQQTILVTPPEPFRKVARSTNFADDEAQTSPLRRVIPQALPRSDETADPNQTRTWGVVTIPRPNETDEDADYELVNDTDLEPQVTRPFDVSEFRRDDKNKKDGR